MWQLGCQSVIRNRHNKTVQQVATFRRIFNYINQYSISAINIQRHFVWIHLWSNGAKGLSSSDDVPRLAWTASRASEAWNHDLIGLEFLVQCKDKNSACRLSHTTIALNCKICSICSKYPMACEEYDKKSMGGNEIKYIFFSDKWKCVLVQHSFT